MWIPTYRGENIGTHIERLLGFVEVYFYTTEEKFYILNMPPNLGVGAWLPMVYNKY